MLYLINIVDVKWFVTGTNIFNHYSSFLEIQQKTLKFRLSQ